MKTKIIKKRFYHYMLLLILLNRMKYHNKFFLYLINFYLFTFGMGWIMFYLYLRIIKERNPYNINDIKDIITDLQLAVIIIIIVFNLLIIINNLYKLDLYH
jgi:hypothetical protein